MDAVERRDWVVARARELGFDLCGVAPVDGLDELACLPEWLARGYAGEMAYLRDPRRASPASVLEGTRSLIVCALNYNTSPPYFTQTPQNTADLEAEGARGGTDGPRGWVSRYAWGDDYHKVLGERLDALVARMRAGIAEPFEARAYVDTGPIVERVAARHAGLGWLAKNTCLINEQMGSWLFLGVIIITLDLAPSLGPAEGPPPDLCGNCTLCIDACPTGAIVEPYVLDARRCISYLTIELRGSIPEELRAPMGRHVFGCDICQDVCPWNRAAPVTAIAQFQPRSFPARGETGNLKLETRPGPTGSQSSIGTRQSTIVDSQVRQNHVVTHLPLGTRHSVFSPSLEWLASLSEDEFRELFRDSAIRRTKWRGLVRNACVALGNSGLRPAWCHSESRLAGTKNPSSADAIGAAGRPVPAQVETSNYDRVVVLLERLAVSGDAVVAEHAGWALVLLRHE